MIKRSNVCELGVGGLHSHHYAIAAPRFTLPKGQEAGTAHLIFPMAQSPPLNSTQVIIPQPAAGHERKILPVIMAGGAGTRLWPLSTSGRPKQFEALIGPRSSFEEAILRTNDPTLFLPPVIITTEASAVVARTQARRAGVSATFIVEPSGRDSAAAMAVAACYAARFSPETIVLALAADHHIGDVSGFIQSVREGLHAAATGSIVLFGIAPTGPSTAFGYIRREPGSSRVAAFVEKPDIETAARYVADGYLWNSGNVLFRADRMLSELQRLAPGVLGPAREALDKAGPTPGGLLLDATSLATAPAISIDIAVMEKAENVVAIEGRFDWSDIGSLASLWQTLPHDFAGNAIAGEGHAMESAGNLILAADIRIIAAGVSNHVIVAGDNAVLVFPRQNPPDMRDITARFAQPSVPPFPRPVASLESNSSAFETIPLVDPTGFREYDARWWLGPGTPQLNLVGAEAVGLGLGTLLAGRGCRHIVTGHDFRSYSQAIKLAVSRGLMSAGLTVHDIGLAITPMAYFAQFELKVPAVAMITASHNENGWTGIKMGAGPPTTFGPEDMAELKSTVLDGAFIQRIGGAIRYNSDMRSNYIAALTARPPFARKLRAVVATGNGTAGAFAPEILARLGVDVIPLHTGLDHGFPHYNPNPEDFRMLDDIARAVTQSGADIGLGFDGDGDRCGVVDNEGQVIFADKVGLLIARDLSTRHPGARFVVDAKSTSLFHTDTVLMANGASTDYFKTGHSHIKRRVQQLGAIAAFEKSGHFVFNTPLGRGYDDGMAAAIAILDLLDRAPRYTMAELYRTLPQTWISPTLSAACADLLKDGVVARLTSRLQSLTTLANQPIVNRNTINGIRVTVADGTWGLIRASSNKPELVIVVESPVSEARQCQMLKSLDSLLREYPEVGALDQVF